MGPLKAEACVRPAGTLPTRPPCGMVGTRAPDREVAGSATSDPHRLRRSHRVGEGDTDSLPLHRCALTYPDVYRHRDLP